MAEFPYCKLEIFIPETHLDVLRQALTEADAGHIGSYDCCPNGCIYCYANRSAEVAARNYAAHDVNGECLM